MKPKTFEEKTRIGGMTAALYMANLLEEWEDEKVEMERAKVTIGMMRQVNNSHHHLLRAMLSGI